jgi:phospholipid/cholesterol/gamma-HCH transport system substrate-binding protein
MDADRRTSLTVGLFALAALGAFAVGVLSLTGERGPFRPRYRLVAYFNDVQGLAPGAPVRLAGKDVGTVESVAFSPLGSDKPPIRVELSIDASVQDRIRGDSQATIGTIGLLGDRYIDVSLGTLAANVLPKGAELRSASPLDIADVVAKGTQALDSVASLAANANQVVDEFRAKMGGAKIADSVRTLGEIVTQVKEGKGLLHSLIYDPYSGEGVGSITRSLAELEGILKTVAHGDGLLHAVIYEPREKQELLGPAREASAHLASILAKIDRGEGTLGLLVTDPTLYDDMKQLVGGAQRSAVVRSLIHLSTEGEDKAP